MRPRLPPLSTLRLFEAAARLLSFRKAAEELLLTPSAVSHGIQTLEAWLGAELFARSPRGLALTAAGAAYYPVVREALDLLAEGTRRVADGRAGGRIAVSAAPTFAARWLLPRLPRFRARHPDIVVAVDTAQEQVGLPDQEIDAAIRMGDGHWPGVSAERLVGESLVPVCRPDLAGRQLSELTLIHVTTVSEDWAYWAKAAGQPLADGAPGLRFDTLHMAFEAAAAGLGVAIGRRPLVDPDLASGRLARFPGPAVPSGTAYWLILPESRLRPPHLEAFRRWLLEEAAAS